MRIIHTITIVALTTILLIGCSSEPETFEEYLAAGKKALGQADYPNAREKFGKALRLRPSDRDALLFMGLSYQRDMIVDSAFVYLKRADILYPESRDINLELLEVARALGEWQAAADAMRVLIATGDSERKWIPQLVDAYAIQNEGMATRYWGRKQLAYDTTDPQLYLKVATSLVMMDSIDAGLGLLDTAIQRFGERPELLANRATFHAYGGNYELAEREFRDLLKTDSTNTSLLVNLANVLSSQESKEKKREALRIFRSIELPPDDPRNIDSLIVVLEEELKE